MTASALGRFVWCAGSPPRVGTAAPSSNTIASRSPCGLGVCVDSYGRVHLACALPNASEATAAGVVQYLVANYEVDNDDAFRIARSQLALVFTAIESGATTSEIGDRLAGPEMLRERPRWRRASRRNGHGVCK